jgi:glutamate/tyrosine decarboxylase-like PLP-dependent enzyme
MQLPKQGLSRDDVLARMRERKQQDADWRGARTFSLIYPAGEDVDEMLHDAGNLYLYENALNPFRFPSLREMEVEVVEMTASLLHAPESAGGCMTSGGTESIIMAVKAARERARAERDVTEPNMVIPVTAHPAFAKAASYLGIELRLAPIGADLRAEVDGVAELLDDRSVLVVGSAPNYPHGMVDPIPELAALAQERGISCHTDSCLGGFMLPFYERLGEPVPPFDFRVPGVTTMSADVHKYGYCVKGASVVLHRDEQHLKKHQLFVYDRWPGGLYASFAMAGARPALPIAAAWEPQAPGRHRRHPRPAGDRRAGHGRVRLRLRRGRPGRLRHRRRDGREGLAPRPTEGPGCAAPDAEPRPRRGRRRLPRGSARRRRPSRRVEGQGSPLQLERGCA